MSLTLNNFSTNPGLIHDTHAHLDYLLVQDPNFDIVSELKKYRFWIQPGVNLLRDRFCLENFLNNKNGFEKMFFMIGAHPGEVSLDTKKWNLDIFLKLQQDLIKEYKNELANKIVAIGEIGLDYKKDMEQDLKDNQKKLFIAQLDLSHNLKLPFVIHCRDAFDDLFEIIEAHKNKQPFLIHCFTGNLNHYNKALSLRQKDQVFVALGGIVTYKNTESLNDVAKIADNLVLETDLPWLAPTPHRGKVNQPEYILEIANYLATLRCQTPDQVWDLSFKNSLKIFPSLNVK